ncbi:MAG: threonylcarbamoyladenosine tRNA methylthiotransferase [Candidatus Woesearchaeota archaeon]|nr:threonylcarbamoyladenosine tRNA methylthiotransferase [Candidatus Woesearchaeota archaeon]
MPVKVFIQTFGCSANKADSELMRTLIQTSKKYELVDNFEDAEIVIINSCTVKQNAETKFWKSLRLSLENKKKVIAAGCVPQADETSAKNLIKQGVSILGVRDVDKVLDALDSVSQNKQFVARNSDNKEFHKIKIKVNDVIGIVPINEGCLGNCTYCKTKFSRGNLLSYEPKLILNQIENFLKQGVKELWITSQDSGAYGYDLRYDGKYLLPNLIRDILSLDFDFRLRIGMMNPNHAVRIIDDVLSIMNEDKRVFRFLHIPVQSASSKVLKDMHRGYDSKLIYDLFSKIRSFDDRINLSTDIICGFPTESEPDFDETIKFVEKFKPDIINISRFWPRPGTKAAELKPLYNQVPIKRARKLRELFNSYCLDRQKTWLGWEGEVLIDEIGKKDSLIGRNNYYKQVILKNYKDVGLINDLMGSFVKVRVEKTTCFDLRAKIIN